MTSLPSRSVRIFSETICNGMPNFRFLGSGSTPEMLQRTLTPSGRSTIAATYGVGTPGADLHDREDVQLALVAELDALHGLRREAAAAGHAPTQVGGAALLALAALEVGLLRRVGRDLEEGDDGLLLLLRGWCFCQGGLL